MTRITPEQYFKVQETPAQRSTYNYNYYYQYEPKELTYQESIINIPDLRDIKWIIVGIGIGVAIACLVLMTKRC